MVRTKVIRCYGRQVRPDLWETFSIELGLAARGKSKTDAIASLEAQVDDYIAFAKEEPPAQRDALLRRKAPLLQVLVYHSLVARNAIKSLFNNNSNTPPSSKTIALSLSFAT